MYSKLIKNIKCIYSFEPQKEIFKLLEDNINNNNLLNVKIFNNAIGHIITDTMSSFLYDGYDCKIEYNTIKILNYEGFGLGENGEKIKIITIDSLELDNCNYIKIDIEGSEILALMGGINTITKFKPIILFEKTDKIVTDKIKRSLNINFKLKNPCNFLTDISYNLKKIDENNYLAIYI